MGGRDSESNLTVGHYQKQGPKRPLRCMRGCFPVVLGARKRFFVAMRTDPILVPSQRKKALKTHGEQPRTVDNGTDNLVNLSNEASIGAGEPGTQGRESIGSERLESATSHRGRSGKGSPPEGPGEAAVNKNEQRSVTRRRREGGSELNWLGDAPLEHCDGCLRARGYGGGRVEMRGWQLCQKVWKRRERDLRVARRLWTPSAGCGRRDVSPDPVTRLHPRIRFHLPSRGFSTGIDFLFFEQCVLGGLSVILPAIIGAAPVLLAAVRRRKTLLGAPRFRPKLTAPAANNEATSGSCVSRTTCSSVQVL